MRAIMCRELGTPDVLTLEDLAEPEAGPGEVKIAMRAAGLNFPDVLMVAGGYQLKPELPFTPGMEAAGDVVAVGEGVEHVAPGDRVIAALRFGAFAERLVVPAASTMPMPDNWDYPTAAAFKAAYGTAFVGLVRRGQLEAGETLLVHGASGGVGLAAVELGKILGAKVIATGSNDDKLAVVKQYGADHVLNIARAPDFREAVKDLTGGRGADVIYDPVGGDVFDQSTRCIAWEGRLLVIGFAGGRIPTVSANIPLIKGFSVIGVRAGEYARRAPEKGRENFDTLLAWAAQGRINPHVSHRFPLAEVKAAMQVIIDRQVVGKAVLTNDA